MADEAEAERDFSHVRFPEVPSAQASREALNRKLSQIQAAFDEIERQRQAQAQQVGESNQEQSEETSPEPPEPQKNGDDAGGSAGG